MTGGASSTAKGWGRVGTMRVLFLVAIVCLLGSFGCRHAPPGIDAGAESDAGTADDARTVDDSSPGRDGGLVGPGCPLDYGGCVIFEDHTTSISTTVGISMDGTSYGPACIRIVANTNVAILANAEHPILNAPCSPAGSPIPNAPSQMAASYMFTQRGRYGYYSPNGGTADGTGLAGLIIVE
jgi:hypothetical protein